MGAAASSSVVISLPSTAIHKDREYLKRIFICIDKAFQVEVTPNSESLSLVANDGKLTLLLLPQQQQQQRQSQGIATLVMDESDIKTILKRQKQSSAIPSNKEFATAKVELPGGSILVLVPPSMMGMKTGRQQLMDLLTTIGETKHGNNDGSTNAPRDNNNKETSTGSQRDLSVKTTESQDKQQSTSSPSIDETAIERSKLPSFPTLDFRLLQKDGHLEPNFPLNTRTGVPFETDLFQGKVLFVLRPAGDPAQEDPYWNEKIFKDKQRRVIVQVQGKFKTQPKGILYAGGEVSEPMKLGLLAKGLTNVLLKLLKSFYPTIHTSFGDDEEKAHIVVPAYRFFERLVATKPGDTPPTLGEPFIESAASIKARKNSQSTGEWNTTDLYSLSFYSMYIDMPSWSVVNIPMSNDMSLRTFWGKSSLKILFYDRVAPESVKKHLPEYNNYGFVIQATYLGLSGSRKSPRTVDRVPGSDDEDESRVEQDDATSSEEAGNILDWTEAPDRDIEQQEMTRARSESQIFQVEAENADVSEHFDMNQFFDAEEYVDIEENRSNSALSHAPELLNSVDNLCPAWIEMVAERGNYTRAYALNLPSDATQTVYRKAESVLTRFGSKGPSDNICSERMSSAEHTRRHLGQLLSSCLSDDGNMEPARKLQSATTPYDETFLKRKRPSISEKGKIYEACFVARALSDHHWIEEWVTVTERSVSFYHPDRKKANHRIGIQSIVRVARLESKDAPCFPNHSFLSVETLGRATYLMFPTEEQRNLCFEKISKIAKLAPTAMDAMETSSDGNASTALLELQNPKDEFLHKSSVWDFKHRRVLNCRRFSFRARDKASQRNPLLLAENALRKALDSRNESDDDILVSFLDSAALLKEANVHELSEVERLSFFLNIYHTMVQHAYLVLGVPKSSFQWVSYFNSISYQCSDDIFSLAELEHCIIRSTMSYPTQFLSRFVLPKSTYDFAMTKRDFRINFALNCGSRSNPECVPVFKPTLLNQQLDDVSRLYLAVAKLKKRGNRDAEVILPRICLWFSNDFGAGSEDILEKTKPLLSSTIQDYIAGSISGEKGKCDLPVKYLPYSFECRKLVLAPDPGGS